MKMLVKCLGGSKAFGLDTPESDTDYRGVFVNTDPGKILGLEKHEHMQKQEADDEVYFEVRKFFDLLKNGNTGALEILYTSEYMETSPMFEEIRSERHKFIDTDKMFRCLLGYIQGERRLANGERSGVLGSKRKAHLEKYGFSPKNFVQLFRLAYCGETLFLNGYFPVNIKNEEEQFWGWLMDVKTNPQSHTKEGLNLQVDKWEERLKKAYDNRKYRYQFDHDLANDMLRRAYLPYLIK